MTVQQGITGMGGMRIAVWQWGQENGDAEKEDDEVSETSL